MSYTNVTWVDDEDITEGKLDQMSGNGAYCHNAVQVLPLHNAHLRDMRWPVDIILDETTIASGVVGPVFPFYPQQFNNIRIDGLNEGFHSLALVNASTPRTYKIRFFKTAEMSFLTLWLIYYNNDLHAVTINILGHTVEQGEWI